MIGRDHLSSPGICRIYNASKLPLPLFLHFNSSFGIVISGFWPALRLTLWMVILAGLPRPFAQGHSEKRDSYSRHPKEIADFSGSQLQNIHNELYMDAMVLEVTSRWGIGDVIELLAPIDIGKGAIEKA